MQFKLFLRPLCSHRYREKERNGDELGECAAVHCARSKRIDAAATTIRQSVLNGETREDIPRLRLTSPFIDWICGRSRLSAMYTHHFDKVELEPVPSSPHSSLQLTYPSILVNHCRRIQQLHLWSSLLPEFEYRSSSCANLNNLISLTRFAGAVYRAESELGPGLNPE